MAAFVASMLAQASDRTPWLTAILSSRFARPGSVILATALALAVGNGVAAVGGMLIGPRLSPNAQALFLALALVSAGASALWTIKPPDRLEGWRTGAFLTSFLGVLILAAGDRTQFITLALAGRTPIPALAAVGATLGSMAVNVPAILLGERARRRLPITGIRIVSGTLFLLVGIFVGLSGMGLI